VGPGAMYRCCVRTSVALNKYDCERFVTDEVKSEELIGKRRFYDLL